MNTMKRQPRLVMMLCVAAAVAGCADLSTNVFRFEQTTADVAHKAMEEYAGWWKGQTNGATPAALAELVQERDQVMGASRSLGQSLRVLEGWRVVYTTNSASKPQLQAAWDGVRAQSSNIVWLVNWFREKPRFAAIPIHVPVYVFVTNAPPTGPPAEAPAPK